MKATKIPIIAVIAIMVLVAVAVPFQSDSADADVNDAEVYQLTYYAEIEGNVVMERVKDIAVGTQVPMYAVAGDGAYTFAGWEYKGELYEVGDKFTMPAKDVTLNAMWDTSTLAGDVVISEIGQSTIMIILAMFLIVAIVVSMIVARMRASALRDSIIARNR